MRTVYCFPRPGAYFGTCENGTGTGRPLHQGDRTVRIDVICIGTEILIGETLNTNLAFIGRTLAEAGYTVAREVCIPDDPPLIRDTASQSLTDTDLTITVGGLGPTADDMTKSAIADLFGLPLVHHPETAARIRARLSKRKITIPDAAVREQSLLPAGATVVPNHHGSAPGLWCTGEAGRIVMLPGPPRELRPMFRESILPAIRRLGPPLYSRVLLRVVGLPESRVEEEVVAALGHGEGIDLAFCADPACVRVRLTAPPTAEEALRQAAAAIRQRLGARVLPAGSSSPAEAVGDLLRSRGWFLATAESCTGGGIAAAVTRIPGASAFFQGGVVTYSNECKRRELGVRSRTLTTHGAVSARTVGEMLDGAMAKFGVDAAIAISGIAGPDGGTPDKPVGLLYIGTAVHERRRVERRLFPGAREDVRARAVQAALGQLREDILAAPVQATNPAEPRYGNIE